MMMRIAELPRAIRAAIDDWRLWVTVSLTAAVIINEAVIGIREGQPLSEALTRMPFYRTLYLLLVFSIIAQAGIGAVPVVEGVVMTLADWARQRRRNWKEEGRKEALPEFRREQINKVLADDTLTAELKVRFIAILNAV